MGYAKVCSLGAQNADGSSQAKSCGIKTSLDPTDLLDSLKQNFFHHLAYCTDQEPSDFHIFLYLKEHFDGKRFENVEGAVRKFLCTVCTIFLQGKHRPSVTAHQVHQV